MKKPFLIILAVLCMSCHNTSSNTPKYNRVFFEVEYSFDNGVSFRTEIDDDNHKFLLYITDSGHQVNKESTFEANIFQRNSNGLITSNFIVTPDGNSSVEVYENNLVITFISSSIISFDYSPNESEFVTAMDFGHCVFEIYYENTYVKWMDKYST